MVGNPSFIFTDGAWVQSADGNYNDMFFVMKIQKNSKNIAFHGSRKNTQTEKIKQWKVPLLICWKGFKRKSENWKNGWIPLY